MDVQFNWSILTGYDFFISYRRSDAAPYASRLEKLLREADFRCFLDDNEASAGEPLTARIRAGLRRSKVLILLASPGVRASKWVAEELEIFAETGRDIIPVGLGSGLVDLSSDTRFAILWKRDLLRLEEEYGETPPSEPSARVLGEIQKNFKHRRANRNLRLIFALVGALLLGATGFSYWQKTVADAQRSAAVSARRDAESNLDLANIQRNFAEVAQKKAETETGIAVNQEKIATRQTQIAEERLKVATSQAVASESRRQAAQDLNEGLLESAQAYRTSPSIEAKLALFENLGRAGSAKRYFFCPGKDFATVARFASDTKDRFAFVCLGQDQRSTIHLSDHAGTTESKVTVDGDVRDLTFLNQDTILLSGAAALRVVDVPSRRVETYPGSQNKISAFAFGTTMSLAFSADESGEVRAWQRKEADGKAEWISKVVKGLKAGSGAKLAYRSGQNKLYVIDGYRTQIATQRGSSWELDTTASNAEQPDHRSLCAEQFPPSVRYFEDASSSDASLYAYTTESNDIIVENRSFNVCKSPWRLVGHTHNIYSLAFSSDDRALLSAGAVTSADDRKGIILWDLGQSNPLSKTLESNGVEGSISRNPGLALSFNGSSWVYVNSRGAILWNGETVRVPDLLSGSSFESMALAPNGQELAIGTTAGDVVRIARTPGGFQTAHKGLGTSPISELWYSDGMLFALTENGSIIQLLENGGQKVSRTVEHPFDCRAAGGQVLAIERQANGDSSQVSFYNLHDGSVAHTPVPTSGGICGGLAYAGGAKMAFRTPLDYQSPLTIDAAGGRSITFWANPVRDRVSGLKTILDELSVSEDGRILIARSNGSTVVIIDTSSHRLLGEVEFPDTIEAALSGNGKLLLIAHSGDLSVWDIDPEDWDRLAFQITGRSQ